MNNIRIKQISKFIKEIWNCQDIDQEKQLVDKKLNKIRNRFMKPQNGAMVKKYIWVMNYINSLGYNTQFGYKEIIQLMKSDVYSEKYTGYSNAHIIIQEPYDQIFQEMIPILQNDLYSKNEGVQTLAISLIAQEANSILCQSLHFEILKIALGESQITLNIRKKAILALNKIYNVYKNSIPFETKKWLRPLQILFDKFQNELSFCMVINQLLLSIFQQDSSKNFEPFYEPTLNCLKRLAIDQNCDQQYKYYQVSHPWLQISCFRLLLAFPQSSLPNVKSDVQLIANQILHQDHTGNQKNQNNTHAAIFFEIIKLIIKYKKSISLQIQEQILSLLVIFMEFENPNIKYLAFDACQNALLLPGSQDALKGQMAVIFNSLVDADQSICRRALDLLYLMCNQQNVGEIIDHLLKKSEKSDQNLKEELVLKIAILAESFAPNLEWYLDVIISLLAKPEEFVSEDIWWRCCQIITGFNDNINKQLQEYSVGAIMHVIGSYICSENLIKMASFIVPEFGLQNNQISPKRIFNILSKYYPSVSNECRLMILDAYFKIAGYLVLKEQLQTQDEEILNSILSEFKMLQENNDLETQKRAFEYSVVLNSKNKELFESVFQDIDTFDISLQENNKLLSKMIRLLSQKNTKENIGVQQVQELILKKQEILKSKYENYRLERDKGNLKYEDLFIDSENVEIKFFNFKELVELCGQRMALKGQHILLTPDNIELPKQGLRELKQLLTKNSGLLYEDKSISIEFKSENKFGRGRAALRISPKTGSVQNLQAKVVIDGGLKFQISNPVQKEGFVDLMLNYTNADIMTTLPELQIFFSQNQQPKTISLSLPLFINKFAIPYEIDNLTYQQIYNWFTQQDKYFKIDEFFTIGQLKTQKLNDFMKKVKIILGSFMNTSVNVFPQLENIQVVYGTGQIIRISDDNQAVPFIIEIECFEEMQEHIRLSIRSALSPFVVHSLYQILNIYLQMAL